jgi:cold shock CspA family protein
MPGQPYMGTGGQLLGGLITAFDAARGTGAVTADDGTVYPFHCIEIADGTRTIDAGTRVEFALLAKFGHYQAAQIRPR